jgi:hypothetical protein
MRRIIRTILLSSAALCATAAFADTRARANLPFNFVVRGQSFPAGYYDVVMDDDQKFITLASETNSAKTITMVLEPADPANAPAVLSFDVSTSGHSLRAIHMGVRTTGDLDARDRRASISAPAGQLDLQQGVRGKQSRLDPPLY